MVVLASIADVRGGGKLGLSGKDFVTDGFPAYGAGGLNGRLRVFEHDGPAVVLSSIGARCGKCFVVDGRWTSLANTQVILPQLGRVDARFLWYQLNDESRWPRSGTAQPFIKPSDVKAHKVWLPELSEQRRIAAILDQADALRTKRREAIAYLDNLAQAVFSEMFPTWSSRQQRRVRLRSIAAKITKGTTPTSVGLPFEDEGVPFLRVQNLARGTLSFDKSSLYISRATHRALGRSHVHPGDVLVSIAGTIGRSAIVPNDAPEMNCNQAVAIVRLAEPRSAAYVRFWLCSKEANRQIETSSVTATISNLSLAQLGDFELAVPEIEEQIAFARRIDALEVFRSTHESQLERLDGLFASLQDRAFAGNA
jgi:type I restriction enzyme S subunit